MEAFPLSIVKTGTGHTTQEMVIDAGEPFGKAVLRSRDREKNTIRLADGCDVNTQGSIGLLYCLTWLVTLTYATSRKRSK